MEKSLVKRRRFSTITDIEKEVGKVDDDEYNDIDDDNTGNHITIAEFSLYIIPD